MTNPRTDLIFPQNKGNFQFEAWNLGEAKLGIKYFLSDQNLCNIGKNEHNFLNKVKDKIDYIFNNSRRMQTDLVVEDLKKIDPYNTLKKMRTHSQNLVINLHSEIDSLILEIDNEYQIHLNNIKNNNLDYVNFLQNIKNCCLGIVKNNNEMENQLKKLTDKKLFYKMSTLSGILFVPFIQGLDVFRGIDLYGNSGKCFGYIHRWAKQICKAGFSDITMLLDSNSYKSYKHQAEIVEEEMHELNIDPINLISLCSFVDTMPEENIYMLSFAYGYQHHMTGMRQITSSNQIEFFDPNFGIFIFKDKNQFLEWFPKLIIQYEILRFDIQSGKIHQFKQKQPKNSTSCLSPYLSDVITTKTKLLKEKYSAKAKANYNNKIKLHEKYFNRNYRFLLSFDDTSFLLDEKLENGESLIIKILNDGFVHVAQFLLQNASQEARLKIKLQTIDGSKALYNSIKRGDYNLIKWLLSKNIPVNIYDLELAFELNIQLELITALIENGCKSENKKHFLDALFKLAIKHGKYELVEKLIAENINIDEVDCDIGDTPLIIAVAFKHENIAKLLISHHCDCRKVNKNGVNALMRAVPYGSKEIISMLVKQNIDINLKDCHGNTALLWHFLGLNNVDNDIVDILLQHGANPFLVNENYESALGLATNNHNVDSVSLFMEHLTYPDIEKELAKAFIEAAKKGFNDIFEIILAKANTMISSHNKFSALLYGVLEGNQEIVVNILAQKIDLNQVNEDGVTPLICAVRKNHLSIVKLLLQHGAHPNLAKEDGKDSPLHEAILNDASVNIIEVLINSGANLKAKNKNNEYPLDIAIKNNQGEMVRVLQQATQKLTKNKNCKPKIKSKLVFFGTQKQSVSSTSRLETRSYLRDC